MLSSFIDAASTLGLVAVAELGDKSQLVCIGLAARDRGLPVLIGATVAFALLNLLAVAFGGAVALWLPGWVMAAIVAVLFAGFGVQTWRSAQEADTDAPAAPRAGHSVLIGAFMLIFLAEFGDKTQLTVAALSGGSGNPVAVWLGATFALTITSLVAILAGRKLLQRLRLGLIHRVSALLFLGFAGYAAFEAISRYGNI